MPLNRLAAFSIIVFLHAISNGDAIKCWECNSKYDHRCGDKFNNFSVALVDCNQRSSEVQHLLTEGEEPQIANLCRKTVQIVSDEVRVVRGCGWIPNEGYYKDRSCYLKTGTHHIQVFHCACKEDGCNRGSSSFTTSVFTIVPVLFTLLILTKF